MSTFATANDVVNYIEGWQTVDQFALERLIQRAETDVNRMIIALERNLPPTQVISIPGATGGNFVLGWHGGTPQNITEAYNVTGAQLQTDLQALTDIGAGNVTVLGSNPYTLVWSPQWSSGYPGGFVPVVSIDPTGLGPGIIPNVVEVEGRKVDPINDLTRNQALALSRATCAQVEYRNKMGEDFFVKSQYDSVKGPDFATQGRLPQIGAKVFRELAQTGLSFRQGRAVASGYRRASVARGWPTY